MLDCQSRMQKNRGHRAKLAKPLCMPLTFVELGELLAEFTGPASVVSHSWEALTHILQHFCQEIDRLSLCNIPLHVYLLPCVSIFRRLECFHCRDIFRTKLLLTSLLNRALLSPVQQSKAGAWQVVSARYSQEQLG